MIEQAVLADELLNSAKKVFETMVFMNVEQANEPDLNIEGWALLSSITFKGQWEGCLGFCCSAECAKTIAKNMLALGKDESISEEEICDAMCEVTNMIMGCFKSQLKDDFGNCDVSTPSVVSGRELKNNIGERANKTQIKVCIEDRYVGELSLLFRKNPE